MNADTHDHQLHALRERRDDLLAEREADKATITRLQRLVETQAEELKLLRERTLRYTEVRS